MAETTKMSQEAITSIERKRQLIQIMEDAVVHVLERPDERRGPYLINNRDIQLAGVRRFK